MSISTGKPSVEASALRILSIFKRHNARSIGAIHYSGVYSALQESGLPAKDFRAAIVWLTDRKLLDLPRQPVDSYVITQLGLERAA